MDVKNRACIGPTYVYLYWNYLPTETRLYELDHGKTAHTEPNSMRHDYNLPPDWEAMSDEEKSQWMTQERCRRQALSQETPTSKELEHTDERLVRTLTARGYEPLTAKR